MRIAFLHNWSWLGSAVARSLLRARTDELWLIGAPADEAERDPELIELAAEAGVPSLVPPDVARPPFLDELRRFAPDLLVVVTFPKKLPAALLEVPRAAAINVHASLLPRYRGGLPEFWVIRNGEPESGVTIHHLSERFDAGPILAQARFPLAAGETLLSLSMRLSVVTPPLLDALLARYRAGERPAGEPQDESLATPAPSPREEHLTVSFAEPHGAIQRLLRAAYPVFEAATTWRGRRVVVRRITLAEGPPRHLAPGELLVDRARRRVLAGTGDAVVVLEALELDGVAFGGDAVVGLADRLGGASGDLLGS